MLKYFLKSEPEYACKRYTYKKHVRPFYPYKVNETVKRMSKGISTWICFE